jgi:hypothetical protein
LQDGLKVYTEADGGGIDTMLTATIILFPFFGFGFVFYFLPSIVAFARSKRDLLSIFLLNLFLGWTLIGWIVALVWAAKVDTPLAAR